MPRIVNGRKMYSAAEKAAYYKRKSSAGRYVPTVRGRGDYKVIRNRLYSNYRKPYKYAGLGRRIGSYAGRYVGSQIPGVGGDLGGAIGGLKDTVYMLVLRLLRTW